MSTFPVRLERGDCVELMAGLPAESVDLVLADLPYGVTGCRWDKRIPMQPLWEQYRRVLKEHGAIVLFAQQPFATDLINAARPIFRYEWIWDKGAATGFANARRMPMRRHENILVFYKHLPTYHPQGLKPCRPRSRSSDSSEVYGGIRREAVVQCLTGYPQSIVRFGRGRDVAACQKPVGLLEYLVRTYTAEDETVLDNVMGTGSTGVAAANTGRAFIGFELDPERFRIAERRINEAISRDTSVPSSDAARRSRCRHAAHQRSGGSVVRKSTAAPAGGDSRSGARSIGKSLKTKRGSSRMSSPLAGAARPSAGQRQTDFRS